jgi:hypothetical protein
MTSTGEWRPNLAHFGVQPTDPGWIYAVKNGQFVKVGKTKDPNRRLLGEARTWAPDLEVIGVKPFWNISRVERSLHAGLAEHWHRGEWHKFDDANVYWLNFFTEAFKEFSDNDRDMNSVNFGYWMQGTNYAEFAYARHQHKMSLRQWQECRAYPWNR